MARSRGFVGPKRAFHWLKVLLSSVWCFRDSNTAFQNQDKLAIKGIEVPSLTLGADTTREWGFVQNSDVNSSIIMGDINGDGQVDVSDYIGVANYILGIPQADFNEQTADVNEDGAIDVSDSSVSAISSTQARHSATVHRGRQAVNDGSR